MSRKMHQKIVARNAIRNRRKQISGYFKHNVSFEVCNALSTRGGRVDGRHAVNDGENAIGSPLGGGGRRHTRRHQTHGKCACAQNRDREVSDKIDSAKRDETWGAEMGASEWYR
jgi:hypothetical protein